MGKQQRRIREAARDFHEPSPAWTVIEGGSGRDRRPGPLGASCENEARYEAPLPANLSLVPVRPQSPLGPPESGEAAAAPRLRRVPPPKHDQAEAGRPPERRSADAGLAPPCLKAKNQDHVESFAKEAQDGYAVLSRVGPPASEAAARRVEARKMLARLLVRYAVGRGVGSPPARKAA
jgi:hypothetical protein